MKYLIKLENYAATNKLHIYKKTDEILLNMVKSQFFKERFISSLKGCLIDIYGKEELDKMEINYSIELIALLINNFNRYCYEKNLIEKQIIIELGGINRLYDYIWGFRKAILDRNHNPHLDVQYFQRHAFRPLFTEGYITKSV